MSLMLRSMSFEHFALYRERQELPLAGLGLVLIQGQNRISEAMSSNGAGKTSIPAALSWCLFGETPRGQKGEDVACRFTKDPCRVSVTLGLDGRDHTVTRTARPSSLSLSSAPPDLMMRDIQPLVTDLLGFGFRTFRNAVMFAQGSFERFATADQADQLRMLDEIQGLDFRQALARAKAWRDEAEGRKQELDRQGQEAVRRATELRADLEIAERETASFEEAKAHRVREATSAVTQARQAAARSRDEVTRITTGRAQLTALRAKAEAFSTAQEEAVLAATTLAGLQRDAEWAAQTAATLRQQVEDLIAAGRCPGCRGPLDSPRTVARLRQDFGPDLEAADTEARTRGRLAEAAAKRAKTAHDAVTALEPVDTRVLARQEAEASDAALARATRTMQDADTAVQGRTRDLEDTEASRFSGQDLVARLKRDLQALATQATAHETSSGRAAVTLEVAQYWVEAFGDRGLRSLLFDSVAGFLSGRLAHHLGVLAAGEAAVAVSATSLLKSGATRERLSFSPSWGWGGAGPDTGSNGQDRRVDLALFAALQDLAESRSARPFPLKVWDEPGDSLDAKGQEMFALWIEREIRSRGTGLLITHSEVLAAQLTPNRIWTVVLDRDGAHVEQT